MATEPTKVIRISQSDYDRLERYRYERDALALTHERQDKRVGSLNNVDLEDNPDNIIYKDKASIAATFSYILNELEQLKSSGF